MFKLPSVIIAILLSLNLPAKSPHGDKFSIKCDVCHNPEGWKLKIKNNSFDHTKTQFPLVGQHKIADCRKCHIDLVFSNAKTTCISCHKDMHQQTVGRDCERCHTPASWIVTNITEIHRTSRFPLNGQHAQTDCYQCHKSASLLRFDPIGTGCSDCHTKDFNATSKPSHIASKYPLDCFLCHNENSWQPAKFDHGLHQMP
jgi:Zn finger protein HypA/HybF involved in hydrogenase expression